MRSRLVCAWLFGGATAFLPRSLTPLNHKPSHIPQNHANQVLWQQPLDADAQLPVPRRRRRDAPLQPPPRPLDRQVRLFFLLFSLSLSVSLRCRRRAAGRGRAGQHNGEGSVARADPPPLLPPPFLFPLSPRYELCHVVRTHIGANDSAYSCIFQQEDEARSRALLGGGFVGLGGFGRGFGKVLG